MFANKNTGKSQGSNIEVKVEKKEDAPSVVVLFWRFVYIVLVLYVTIQKFWATWFE